MKALIHSGGGKTREHSRHRYFVKRFLWPFLIVFASLPIVTTRRFGIFGVKHDGLLCAAHGGKGVLSHDVYPAICAAYCFCIVVPAIVYFLVESQRMIKRTLSSVPSVNNEAKQKGAKIEQRSLLYALCIIMNTLAAWAGYGIHFFLLPFGISADWPPLFFTVITFNVAFCK